MPDNHSQIRPPTHVQRRKIQAQPASYDRKCAASSPGLNTPRSVMIPVINPDGVTSKAGLSTATPAERSGGCREWQ
jgi:hypothetical protein